MMGSAVYVSGYVGSALWIGSFAALVVPGVVEVLGYWLVVLGWMGVGMLVRRQVADGLITPGRREEEK